MARHPMALIRNFCIIAHVDHGKSTLADRLIQLAKGVEERKFRHQILDSMELERERGITIKSQAVSLDYQFAGQNYQLNLVDTPGHVDFSYEVSRAIAACEGALLLIDASQGLEAQTISNFYLAMEHDLVILPVINKIDLPSADIEAVKEQIEHELGLEPEVVYPVSAKSGLGVEELLAGIIEWIPPPRGERTPPLQALICDSFYDSYRGAVAHVRVFSGGIGAGDQLLLMHCGERYTVEEVGYFRLGMRPQPRLEAGETGYIIAGIKEIQHLMVGDTITLAAEPCAQPLSGFRPAKPMVFSSIYPIDSSQYEDLLSALARLQLNDAALHWEKDSSAALGSGFRCGFLGLLHLEVTQQRLEREFDLNIVLTAPSVCYRLTLNGGQVLLLDNPANYPAPGTIATVEEPFVRASLILPREYMGALMKLCIQRRGEQQNVHYLDQKRVELVYLLPLAEILYDFYDRLKSLSRGYASFDYEVEDYHATELSKVDILLNGEVVDALALLSHRSEAAQRGRAICKRLSLEIPQHQFQIPIQAAIGSTVIARENIRALRKDVTSKCYGGDITRKKKLLEKQKAGKKKMKMVGRVELPQGAFLSVLRSADE